MSTTAPKPSAALLMLSGSELAAACLIALFAPFAALMLASLGAPSWSVFAAAASALPMIGVALFGVRGPVSAQALAPGAAVIALTAAALAWSGGGPGSPAAPWVFAGLAATAALGGRIGAVAAGCGGVAIALFLFFAPPPPIRLVSYMSGAEREAATLVAWALAGLAVAGAVWATSTAWSRALPPLRHPTIAQERALSTLTRGAEICGLRVDHEGGIRQVVGDPQAVLELSADALQGETIKSIAHPDDVDELSRLLKKARGGVAADGASGASSATLRLKTTVGGYQWVEVTAVPASGLPLMTGGAGRRSDSLLAVRRRWRPKNDLGADAEAADRSTFLAHVSGELRNSLKSIVGYTEILTNELFGPLGAERYRDYARQAHSGGLELLEQVDELLDLAEIEAGRFASTLNAVAPKPLIDGALRLTRARAEQAGVSLSGEVDPDTAPPMADRRALRRVLVNTVLDALRSAHVGDAIHMHADAEEDVVRFSIFLTAQPGAASDSGRADDAGAEQYGRLGRMIATRLTELMEGTLLYTDAPITPGEPMLFAEVLLPRAPEEAIAQAERKVVSPRVAQIDGAADGEPRGDASGRTGRRVDDDGAFPTLSAKQPPAETTADATPPPEEDSSDYEPLFDLGESDASRRRRSA